MNETLYTYTVRNNGSLVFLSEPMPEDQALLEAAKYPEAEVNEVETYNGEDEPGEGEFDRQQ
tara:strand:+ start:187 stop:372 length:186 start_codon:yes stop_codon:yes gene_type:complete